MNASIYLGLLCLASVTAGPIAESGEQSVPEDCPAGVQEMEDKCGLSRLVDLMYPFDGKPAGMQLLQATNLMYPFVRPSLADTGSVRSGNNVRLRRGVDSQDPGQSAPQTVSTPDSQDPGQSATQTVRTPDSQDPGQSAPQTVSTPDSQHPGQFDYFCLMFQSFQQCMNGYQIPSWCMTANAVKIWSMWSYLCSDGKQEYVQHASCLSSIPAPIFLDKCSQAKNQTALFNYFFASLSNTLNNVNVSFPWICDYWNSYVDCMEKHIRQPCGENAVQFYRKFADHINIAMVELTQHGTNRTGALGCSNVSTDQTSNSDSPQPSSGTVQDLSIRLAEQCTSLTDQPGHYLAMFGHCGDENQFFQGTKCFCHVLQIAGQVLNAPVSTFYDNAQVYCQSGVMDQLTHCMTPDAKQCPDGLCAHFSNFATSMCSIVQETEYKPKCQEAFFGNQFGILASQNNCSTSFSSLDSLTKMMSQDLTNTGLLKMIPKILSAMKCINNANTQINKQQLEPMCGEKTAQDMQTMVEETYTLNRRMYSMVSWIYKLTGPLVKLIESGLLGNHEDDGLLKLLGSGLLDNNDDSGLLGNHGDSGLLGKLLGGGLLGKQEDSGLLGKLLGSGLLGNHEDSGLLGNQGDSGLLGKLLGGGLLGNHEDSGLLGNHEDSGLLGKLVGGGLLGNHEDSGLLGNQEDSGLLGKLLGGGLLGNHEDGGLLGNQEDSGLLGNQEDSGLLGKLLGGGLLGNHEDSGLLGTQEDSGLLGKLVGGGLLGNQEDGGLVGNQEESNMENSG